MDERDQMTIPDVLLWSSALSDPAVTVLMDEDGKTPIDVGGTLVGEKVAVARTRAKMGLLLDLYDRHMRALRDGDEPLRERLFGLIGEFEWAFPDVKAEFDAVAETSEP